VDPLSCRAGWWTVIRENRKLRGRPDTNAIHSCGKIQIKNGDRRTFVAERTGEPDVPIPDPPSYRDKWDAETPLVTAAPPAPSGRAGWASDEWPGIHSPRTASIARWRYPVLCQNMVGENQPDLGGFGTIPKANRFG
jgi:hypothetical protein